jgi:hypothetical protein
VPWFFGGANGAWLAKQEGMDVIGFMRGIVVG